MLIRKKAKKRPQKKAPTMETKEGKSYLISALRQQKQNENYVIFCRIGRSGRRSRGREENLILIDGGKADEAKLYLGASAENSWELWTSQKSLTAADTSSEQLLISEPGDY